MSCSGMPARATMPRPSPVLMKAFVLDAKMRPAPPVASSVALRLQDHHLAGFDLHRHDAEHVAFRVTDQIERHPLDEELRPGADVALIQRMQHGVAGAVGRGTGTLHRVLAVALHMAAERTLVNPAVGKAVERHAEMFQLIHRFRRRAAHEFDRVLVAEIVGALDRVVHVPVPVVFRDITQRRGDAALRRDGMRARRKHFRQHGDPQTGFRELEGRPHAGAARANDDRVKLSRGYCHLLIPTESARPIRRTRQASGSRRHGA